MRDWHKWLISLIFGAALGAGVVPQVVGPTADNPNGSVSIPNTSPASNPQGTILGALVGAGTIAAALKAQLDSSKRR